MKFMKSVTTRVVLGSLLLTGANLQAQSDKTEKKLGPAESITHLTTSLAKNDVYQAWASLPKSWRTDINGIAHLIGQKMPSMVWDKVFVVMGRIGGVLDTKAQLFLDMTGGQLPPKMTKEDVLSSIKDVGNVFKMLSKSKISTIQSLQTVDLGDVAEGTASAILKRISANKLIKRTVTKESKGKVTSFGDALSKMTATLISQSGDTAKVTVVDPDGQSAEVNMTKVDGKWLEVSMAQEFSKNLPELKQKLSMELDKFSKQAMMAAGVLVMAEGIVTSLENAKTAEDLQKAFAGLPFNPMAMLGGLGNSRARGEQMGVKFELKEIGNGAAAYFSDGTTSVFPASLKDYDWIDKKIDLSKYVYLAKKGDSYSGDAQKALACEKPDPAKSGLAVVFEDGHVETIKGSFATIEQLRAALKARK